MIGHAETNEQDWRGAFRERVTEATAELRAGRSSDSAKVRNRRIYSGARAYVVGDLTDRQIEDLARIDATQACERAINELIAGRKVAKKNCGEAQ